MDNHPHYIWAVVAVIGIAVGTWVYSSNRANVDNYGKDSTHNEQHRQDWPLSIHIGEGGCANLAAMRSLAKNEKTTTAVASPKH